jgi:hypothetical protein
VVDDDEADPGRGQAAQERGERGAFALGQTGRGFIEQ